MKAQTSSTTSLAISSGLFTAVIAILNLKVELFRSTHSFTLLAGFLCAVETVLFLIAFSDLKDIMGFENCGWLEGIVIYVIIYIVIISIIVGVVIGSIVHPVCTTTSYFYFFILN